MALWSKRAAAPLSRNQWLWVVVLGFSGYYLASYLDFLGLTYITAGLERLILFLHPTIVVLLSAWWLKKPIRPHHFVALALCYGGIALVFTENLNFGGRAHDVALGGALVFASGAIYAFYLIGAGEIVGKIGAMRFTAYAMLVACVFCLLQFLLTHEVLRAGRSRAGLRTDVRDGDHFHGDPGLADGGGHSPDRRQSCGDGRIGRSRGNDFLRHLVLNEPITVIQIAGAALVLAGVALVSVKIDS